MAKEAELGMVGLGVMGRNLLFNIADHDFAVAGFDRDAQKVGQLEGGGGLGKGLCGGQHPGPDGRPAPPRAVMMLVPAGEPVDSRHRGTSPPFWSRGTCSSMAATPISTDTDRRQKEHAEKGASLSRSRRLRGRVRRPPRSEHHAGRGQGGL